MATRATCLSVPLALTAAAAAAAPAAAARARQPLLRRMAAICSCSNGIVLLIAIQERLPTTPKRTSWRMGAQLPTAVDWLSLSAVHDMGCVNSSCSNPKRKPPHPLPNTPIGTLIASSTSAIHSSTMQASLTLRPSATRVFAAKKGQVRSVSCAMNNARHGAPQRRCAGRSREQGVHGSSRDRSSAQMVSRHCSHPPEHCRSAPQRAWHCPAAAFPAAARRRRLLGAAGSGHSALCTLARPFSPSSRCASFTQVRAAAGMKVMAYKVTLQTPDGEQVRLRCAARNQPNRAALPANILAVVGAACPRTAPQHFTHSMQLPISKTHAGGGVRWRHLHPGRR